MTAPRPIFMGVVNVTPNSFSDAGKFFDPAEAIAQARALAEAGASIIDLGAEASSFFRAGVEPVPAKEQLRRLLPVVAGLRDLPGLSIDTRSAEVARTLLGERSLMINDISAGTHDAAMLETIAADPRASLVLMHMSASYPANGPAAADIVAEVRAYLERRIAAAMAAGIARERLYIDPGLGFGKAAPDNWALVLGIAKIAALGVPVIVGASRKRFLESIHEPPQGGILGPILAALAPVAGLARHERDLPTAAVTRYAAGHGAAIHRVHQVNLAAVL